MEKVTFSGPDFIEKIPELIALIPEKYQKTPFFGKKTRKKALFGDFGDFGSFWPFSENN